MKRIQAATVTNHSAGKLQGVKLKVATIRHGKSRQELNRQVRKISARIESERTSKGNTEIHK